MIELQIEEIRLGITIIFIIIMLLWIYVLKEESI